MANSTEEKHLKMATELYEKAKEDLSTAEAELKAKMEQVKEEVTQLQERKKRAEKLVEALKMNFEVDDAGG